MKKGLIISIVFLLVSILLLTYALISYNNKKKFEIPPFDTNSTSGIPKVSEKYEYKELELDGLYTVSLCGNPEIKDNKLKLYFTSNKDNKVYLKVRVYKKDKVIGESGLIKPNEYIENISVKNLKKGDDIIIKIMGYNMENYYSEGSVNLNLTLGDYEDK